MSADREQDDGGFFGVGFMGEEGDIVIRPLAVDDFAADRAGDSQSFQACQDGATRPNFDWRADNPNISPPRAAGCRAQNGMFFCWAQQAAASGVRPISRWTYLALRWCRRVVS